MDENHIWSARTTHLKDLLKMASFLSPLLQDSRASFELVNQRTGQVVAQQVEAALDSATRRKGLLGREGMAGGSALIIAPCGAIHTWFMRFAIDVAFVARDGRVVKVKRELKPWRMVGAVGSHAVIEFPGAAFQSSSIEVGDILSLRKASR
jgi:uncharacterized membrane protein (UPF0127 family)